jgi:membrane associated rhomboid family serine protease
MFIPLKDLNPRRTSPVVNTLLILTNVIVFLYQLTLTPHQSEAFALANATIPNHIRLALNGHGNLEAAFLTIFTSMFLHSGFMHIAGNMLFLWIFGDNVEDYFGHVPYLLF